MLKYVNCSIVFQEVPDEVSLAINISNCPNNCKGCHSDYWKTDIGSLLTPESLEVLLKPYVDDVTCVAFMGGDNDPEGVLLLAKWVKSFYKGKLKTAWYSGKTEVPDFVDVKAFNYIKLGPYIAGFGPLTHKTTNQHMYKVDDDGFMIDITFRFWKK